MESNKKRNTTIGYYYRALRRGNEETEELREQIDQLTAYIRAIRDTANPETLQRKRTELAALRERFNLVLAAAEEDADAFSALVQDERAAAQGRRARGAYMRAR